LYRCESNFFFFFFQAEDGIRDGHVMEFRRVLFRSTILNKAREISDINQRRGLYREAIDLFTARRNIVYIYHLNYIVAFPKNFKGYQAVPDGLIRIKGASWN